MQLRTIREEADYESDVFEKIKAEQAISYYRQAKALVPAIEKNKKWNKKK